MESDSLYQLLDKLGFTDHNSIIFGNNGDYDGISIELEKRFKIIKPDAVYVFNKQPFILFFDLTTENNPQREKEIHEQVWSFNYSPIVFILNEYEVQVLNAFAYSKRGNVGNLEQINLTKEALSEKFSFWNLQSGETWKWLQQEYYDNSSRRQTQKRVNQRLFENIKNVREALIERDNTNLSEDDANTLILRLIFVRYLIDRKIDIDENFIVGKTVSEKRLSFSNLIANPKRLNDLFDKLNINFNGVLFKDNSINLTSNQAQSLSQIFKGEIPEVDSLFYGFDFYFEIFDFSIIPVEVISGIYESIIDPETRDLQSAVYTPPFLVEYILKDTVDDFLSKNKTFECKVFDPSVGSGIFLAQSLRKMIERYKIQKKKVSKKTFSEKIREIAKKNLFGIDINRQALKVTCFSIYITLLDYQEPKDINKYEFPNLLDENLFEANFFDTAHPFNEKIKGEKLDFILGNPPWKKDKSKHHLSWVNSTNIYSKQKKGALEIAQSFLLRTKGFMEYETKAALVVTSTAFYNVSTATKEFKNSFLTSYCLDKFFDLSPVRRLIFEEKDSPASIAYYRLAKGENYLNNSVKHQSLKPNIFLKYYKMLVFEKNDEKRIAQKHFIANGWMFKLALYGGTLDFKFLKRIEKSSTKKIIDLIDNQSLFKGAGIERGKDPDFYPQLIGLKIIENQEITQHYLKIKTENYLNKSQVNLSRGRDLNIFLGEKILFKEQAFKESEPLISYVEETCVFRKGVFSISSNEKELTQILYAIFKSKLYVYFIYLTSGAWGIATRPAIRFNDEYLSFPYIEIELGAKLKLIDLVNQLISFFREKSKSVFDSSYQTNNILDEINDIICSHYGVKKHEKDLIDYVLSVSRYQFQESKQHRFTGKVSKDNQFLELYANIFFDEFEKIYPNEYMQVEIYPLNHFIAMNFVFHKEKPVDYKKIVFPSGKKDEKEILKYLANNLTISQITDTKDPSKNLYIQKDIKGFENDSFYIIKPNEYKCWHRAMAWYDVAEFKEKIERAELISLNNDANEF